MRMTRILTVAVALTGSILLAARGIGGREQVFPHMIHLEAGLDCATCHPASESRDLRVSLLPSTEVCTGCHDGSDLGAWGFAEISRRTPGFRSFPHQTHLEGGLQCDGCHPAAYSEAGSGAAVVVGHDGCFECHDGVQIENDCETCHVGLRDGPLSGQEYDMSRSMPMNHHPGFLGSHEFQVRLEGKECRECHRQEDFCGTCHEGTNVVELVHGRNWLFTHPVPARKNLADCTACHDPGEYCGECHAASGVVPVTHLQTGWRGGANLHAVDARRDIAACAACHEDDADMICTPCHSDDGVRGNQPRLNIHPGGFSEDSGHGWWHDDESATCFACHVNTRTPGSGFCGYCHGSSP